MIIKNIYRYALVTVLCLAFLSSCKAGGGEEILAYQDGITEAAILWEYGGTEYEARIAFDGEIPDDLSVCRDSSVTVTSPDNVSGMTVTYSADGAEASVGNVSFALPENMGTEVYRIVRSLSLYPEEMRVRKNGADVEYVANVFDTETKYTVTYGDEGYPVSAVITWGDDRMIEVSYKEILYT